MKKVVVVFCICLSSFRGNSQADEIQQLLLNWEKLTQFKKILQNMYDGYKILHEGYTAIKDISEGNFNLHKNFLDALLEVSPQVKKYKRISDIINYQLRIVREYKSAYSQFKEDKEFTIQEIEYLGKVYNSLFNESLKSIEELAMVVTAGKLRMTDDERLQAIDKIYESVVEQFTFLKEFNNSTAILSLQRKYERVDVKTSKTIHGIKE